MSACKVTPRLRTVGSKLGLVDPVYFRARCLSVYTHASGPTVRTYVHIWCYYNIVVCNVTRW